MVASGTSDIRRNHSLMFAVTAPPKLGRLVQRTPDNSTRIISTFTQSMVGRAWSIANVCVLCVKRFFTCLVTSRLSQLNAGVVLYDQNKPESVGWSAADSFSFTVSSPPAFLPPHAFTVLISYQANGRHGNPQQKTRLLNNAGKKK